MKHFFFFLLIFILFAIPTRAAVNNSDLIINGGQEQFNLQQGEKIHLMVQDDLTRIPILKGLYFQSSNPLVATVGKRNGILRGIFPGTASIFITAEDGDSATIEVVVENSNADKKGNFFVFLLLLALIILGLYLLK